MFNWIQLIQKIVPNNRTYPSGLSTLKKLLFFTRKNKCRKYKNIGDSYLENGHFEKAADSYRQAINCDSQYAEAYNNLGNAYLELNQPKEAEKFLSVAIKLNPNLTNAYYNLATLQLEQNRLKEAIDKLLTTVTLEPNFHTARALLLFQLQKICNWDNIDSNIKILREATRTDSHDPKTVFSPFTFLSIPSTTAEEQKNCAQRLVYSEYQTQLSLAKKLKFKYSANDKIRIGYVSADFRIHPVSILTAQLFELHSRSQFKIIAYSCGHNDKSPMRTRLENSFDKFVDIQQDSDEAAAAKIFADQIDILVDLTGHTRDNRCGIFALKPAPIQVNFLGYPGTMGAKFFDYIIADQFVIPADQEKYYSETVIRMPHCFMPNDNLRSRPSTPSRSDCGLPENSFIFCCFNQSYKITPEMFSIWCKLLTEVPDSILWLSSSNSSAESNLKREAKLRGVSSHRILIAPKLASSEEHLARMGCADLFLDTIPYNAHATCSDALWMGLPILTCAGSTFASRVAGSLLSTINTPELITFSLEDYYSKARDLSTNRSKLSEIREKIKKNRDRSPLFDSKSYTQNLEDLFIMMYSNHFNLDRSTRQ